MPDHIPNQVFRRMLPLRRSRPAGLRICGQKSNRDNCVNDARPVRFSVAKYGRPAVVRAIFTGFAKILVLSSSICGGALAAETK